MSWRVLRVAIVSWRDPSPGERDVELTNVPITSCYHHILILFMIVLCIINCLTHFFLSPGQQATKCSASSTRIYKTTPDHRKYHSPLDSYCYKDSEA